MFDKNIEILENQLYMLTYIFDNSFDGSNNIKIYYYNKSKHLIVFFLNLEKTKFFE